MVVRIIHRDCGGEIAIKDWGKASKTGRYEAYCEKCQKCDPNGYSSIKKTLAGARGYFTEKESAGSCPAGMTGYVSSTSFAPTININGETVTPKGYEWILGFALAGCEWAIRKAIEPEFLNMVRGQLKQETVKQLERAIQEYEQKIEQLKKEINVHT